MRELLLEEEIANPTVQKRYSLYLHYQHKSTNTDTCKPKGRGRKAKTRLPFTSAQLKHNKKKAKKECRTKTE
jgi:hypothetical protein